MLIFLHYAGVILGYILKGLLSLVAVAIVGVNLVPMLLMFFGLLPEGETDTTQSPAVPHLLRSRRLWHCPVPVLQAHHGRPDGGWVVESRWNTGGACLRCLPSEAIGPKSVPLGAGSSTQCFAEFVVVVS